MKNLGIIKVYFSWMKYFLYTLKWIFLIKQKSHKFKKEINFKKQNLTPKCWFIQSLDSTCHLQYIENIFDIISWFYTDILFSVSKTVQTIIHQYWYWTQQQQNFNKQVQSLTVLFNFTTKYKRNKEVSFTRNLFNKTLQCACFGKGFN